MLAEFLEASTRYLALLYLAEITEPLCDRHLAMLEAQINWVMLLVNTFSEDLVRSASET